MAENEPIFNFMYLRPVEILAAANEQRDYIRDLDEHPARTAAVSMLPRDTSLIDGSQVTKIVVEAVFGPPVDISEGIAQLKLDLLTLLVEVIPVADTNNPQQNPDNAVPIPATELERYSYMVHDGRFFVLPDRLGMLDLPLKAPLLALIKMLTTDPSPSPSDIVKRLEELADNRALSDVVFGDAGHSDEYIAAARELFDVLYLLYVLRRWTSIDLEPIMDALRALHVLEALAVDELVAAKIGGTIDAAGEAKLDRGAVYFPQIADWDGKNAVPGVLPLLAEKDALGAYWAATPVIHPIFAKLFYYVRPFNDIKPIGIGDLKVVKQKLLRYEAGDVSDIHNVMKGEANFRDHRRLEKTEESFSFSSSTEQESQRDSQTTDRSEIKREAEDVIKTEMGGNAGTSVTYNQGMVMATVSAGFAASRSGTSTEKSANNFSKEVVSKALDRVVKRTAEARSTNKTFETEERNRHQFSNVDGNEHVAGIYQWVDKRYQAQVYNFGKRMMFEFIVPEPAALLVEQRMRGYEAALQIPIKPTREPDDALDMGFEASDITEGMFRELKSQYDLDDFIYPPKEIKAHVVDPQTSDTLLKRDNLNSDDQWWAMTCKLDVANVAGYDVDWIAVTGNIQYADHNQPASGSDRNIVAVRVDGTLIWDDEQDNIYVDYATDYSTDLNEWTIRNVSANPKIQLALEDARLFQLIISVRLTRSADGLQAWQESVYDAVKRVENGKLKALNKEKDLAYQSAMTTYNNRLDEIRAVAVNDILQGKSEAYNKALMMTELKRACLSILTKEFDLDESDDVLTEWETMGTFDVSSDVTRMTVDRTVDPATARFKTTEDNLKFPAIDLPEARGKAPYIQFLEQAFEWEQLGWVCYPYFWTPPPKWVSLMSREDMTDASLTEFLQAGAAKVLIAVSPEYDDAVLHYLAAREPWEGGAAPALGDPLYLPLYEEMHKAQDDTYGGTPVGEPWEFTVPTSLVYLSGAKDKLPDFTQP